MVSCPLIRHQGVVATGSGVEKMWIVSVCFRGNTASSRIILVITLGMNWEPREPWEPASIRSNPLYHTAQSPLSYCLSTLSYSYCYLLTVHAQLLIWKRFLTWPVLTIHPGVNRNITLLPVMQLKAAAELMCHSYRNLIWFWTLSLYLREAGCKRLCLSPSLKHVSPRQQGSYGGWVTASSALRQHSTTAFS